MQNRGTATQRPFEMDGKFELVKRGTGKSRIRFLVFKTEDGYAGSSKCCSRREAYENAMAEKRAGVAAEAKLTSEVDAGLARHAAACPKSPERPPIWWTIPFSILAAEIERRGWNISAEGRLVAEVGT